MEWPGVESRPSREALLRSLARSVEGWVESAQQQLSGGSWGDDDIEEAVRLLRRRLADDDDREALAVVLRWALNGLTHSALVALDGGTHDCPTMDVRDSEGRSLGEALHEEWPNFAPE